MSKKIVKKIRESVNYLLERKIVAPLETQKVIEFLLKSTFFDKDDDFFQKIVKAEGCDAEKYKFFNGNRYTKQEDGHYRGYHGKYLHRDVWEFYNGKIPRGYVIHHKDLNPENNSIENLQLMSSHEHRKLHNEIRQVEIYVCENCGKEFESRYKDTRAHHFCSKKCKGNFNYRKYRKTCICQECGKEFETYKYKKVKYCSHKCAMQANNNKKILKTDDEK